MHSNYSKACTEVIELLNVLPEEEYNKIPSEEIDIIVKNRDKNHHFEFDASKELIDQPIMKETYTIILSFFNDYIATEQQQKTLKEILNLNRQKSEIEKLQRYNPDDIFKTQSNQTSNDIENNQTNLIINQETFFEKFIRSIKEFFKS